MSCTPRTKLRKHATTYLLNIPELLKTVKDWDEEIRLELNGDDYWFAPISPETRKVDPNVASIGKHRSARARKDLCKWLAMVGLPYRSPHQFRHGYAVYSFKHAKDVADWKAISQNMMHSDLSITDRVYGILSGDDVKTRVTGLVKNSENFDHLNREQQKALLKQVLDSL